MPGRDATDRDDRHASGRANCARKRVDALDRIGIFLGLRREHRAIRDVVGPTGYRALHLREVVRRDSDLEPRCEPACLFDRQIGLPEVHAIGAGREREVDPIVDEQQASRVVTYAPRHPRDPQDLHR